MIKEIAFNVHAMTLKAQAYGDPSGFPVLALHGWLDNSASFFELAPRLTGCYLVALDLAGHGFSDHRGNFSPYNIWDDVADIFAVADQLGWQQFSLLGHSRGAIISTLAAGTFPERIVSLALIEGVFPEPVSAIDSPLQLASSINAIKALTYKTLKVFKSVDIAVKSRQRGLFPLGEPAARALVMRGLKQVEGGFSWSSDQCLLAPSALKLSKEQIKAFIDRIESPLVLVLASEGLPSRFAHFKRDLDMFSRLNVVHLEGSHHLHMEQQVVEVAEQINQFFANNMLR